MESLNLDFLRNAAEVGYGPVFRNDRYNLAVVQIEGSFTGLSLILEGRTDVNTGPWETVAGWSVTTPDTKTETVSTAGIYEWRIEGIREFRFRILAISSGAVNASGVLYNSADNSTYPYASAPGSITFGDPALFVKGICEQIFFDPSTGNIVGYDNTATDGSVTISINLAEISGGMGNQLIGVLPDTARISGGYTSSAFSLETREKIMGGQIAYNAISQVCERVIANANGELVVSQTPSKFFTTGAEEKREKSIFNKAEAVIENGLNGSDIFHLVSDLPAQQSGTGTPGTNNIRPLVTYQGITFTQTIEGSAIPLTYTSTWFANPGKVYGGSFDIITGELRVNRKYISLTGNEDWQKTSGSAPYFYISTGDSGSVVSESGMSSHFTVISLGDETADIGFDVFADNEGEIRIGIRPSDYANMTVQQFKSWLNSQKTANVPVEISWGVDQEKRYIVNGRRIVIIGDKANTFISGSGNILMLQYELKEPIISDCRCYIRKVGDTAQVGTAYTLDSASRTVTDFVGEPGIIYEVIYFAHNVSAQMLPVPSIWNPVMMTVQERYGVYSKQNGSAEKGVLKGWLYFIVPRAILNADAGENASETDNATTDGSWIAIPEKPENMPFCDCEENAHPVAYYVYVPCTGVNDAVIDVVSVGSGLTLKAGRTAQLPIKLVMPDDSLVQPDFTQMGYYSEDESVATVDNRGIVTAVSEGQTVIHAFVSKSDGSSLDSRTIVAVEGTRTVLTANRNNILIG